MATANKLVNYITKISRKTYNKSTELKSFKNIGSFGSIFDLSQLKMKNPIIVSSTDGVGTKIEIANKFKKYNTIGIDLVAMSVNDLIVQGAKPIFFLDYIATNKLELHKFKKILDGIVTGCKLSGCALIGGETAEMPKTYEKGKFDLAGFAVGLVEKKNLLTKNKIKRNNIILAIPSSGLHSNGYSLIHNILKKKKNYYLPKKIKQELIRPTKIYVNELNSDALETFLINREKDYPHLRGKFWSNDIKDVINDKKFFRGFFKDLKQTFGRDFKTNPVDLVAGGPPCQGFSGIGIRRSYSVDKEQLPSNHLYQDMAHFIHKMQQI